MALVKPPKLRADPIPNIQAAGRVIAMADEGTNKCLSGDSGNQPGTPDGIKKYRKTF